MQARRCGSGGKLYEKNPSGTFLSRTGFFMAVAYPNTLPRFDVTLLR